MHVRRERTKQPPLAQRVWLPFAFLTAAGPRALAQGDPRAHVEFVSQRSYVYAGETASVLLRVDVERALVDEHLVQPFARQLDVPVQVHAVWPDGVLPIDERDAGEPPSRVHATIALDDAVVRARRLPDVQRDGRVYVALELERRFRARPPAIVFPAPSVRLTLARSFETDALGQRIPVELESLVVPGRGLELEVRALPESGRPPEFDGAVGRFVLEASLERREVDLGESVRATLDVRGDGDFAELAPPHFPRARGFDVLGTLVERASERLRVVYDVRPTAASVSELPPIELTFFDPREARYEVAHSEPLALRVRDDSSNRTAANAPKQSEASRAPLAPSKGGSSARVWIAIGIAVVIAIVAALAYARGRSARS